MLLCYLDTDLKSEECTNEAIHHKTRCFSNCSPEKWNLRDIVCNCGLEWISLEPGQRVMTFYGVGSYFGGPHLLWGHNSDIRLQQLRLIFWFCALPMMTQLQLFPGVGGRKDFGSMVTELWSLNFQGDLVTFPGPAWTEEGQDNMGSFHCWYLFSSKNWQLQSPGLTTAHLPWPLKAKLESLPCVGQIGTTWHNNWL